jgi:hypothetical protein
VTSGILALEHQDGMPRGVKGDGKCIPRIVVCGEHLSLGGPLPGEHGLKLEGGVREVERGVGICRTHRGERRTQSVAEREIDLLGHLDRDCRNCSQRHGGDREQQQRGEEQTHSTSGHGSNAPILSEIGSYEVGDLDEMGRSPGVECVPTIANSEEEPEGALARVREAISGV